MKTAEAVRAMSGCPRCGRGVGRRCRTPTGRNHHERVVAALRASLEAYGSWMEEVEDQERRAGRVIPEDPETVERNRLDWRARFIAMEGR